jgi:hypothetical protein
MALSNNPYTVKARKRNEAISNDLILGQIEKAKAADQGAITYAKKVLLKSDLYRNASLLDQATMVQDSAAAVILKR